MPRNPIEHGGSLVHKRDPVRSENETCKYKSENVQAMKSI